MYYELDNLIDCIEKHEHETVHKKLWNAKEYLEMVEKHCKAVKIDSETVKKAFKEQLDIARNLWMEALIDSLTFDLKIYQKYYKQHVSVGDYKGALMIKNCLNATLFQVFFNCEFGENDLETTNKLRVLLLENLA